MKKRLRKKLHLGEFTEYGVALWVRFKPWKTQDEGLDFFDVFAEFIEQMDLLCGGALGDVWDIFMSKKGRGSVTEQDKDKIKKWLMNYPEVIDFSLSELQNAWHGDYIEYNEEQKQWEVVSW